MKRLLSCVLALCAVPCGAAPPPAPAPQVDPGASPRMPGVPFEELARQAREAWAAGRAQEALPFFRAGVELNPRWDEGWWYIGSTHYEAGRFADARDAFHRVVQLKPEAGPAWALLGLCEYELAEYDAALDHLWNADMGGLDRQGGIGRVAYRHLALLLIRQGQFDLSLKYLTSLAIVEPESPQLLAACGLMTLRMPVLPSDVPDSDRELVMMTGGAVYSALGRKDEEARERFDALIARHPTAPRVHYAYGLYLSLASSEDALPMLRREVELFPDNAQAHIQIAFEILTRGAPADALPSARASVLLAPDLFASHLALGRVLVETGAIEEGLDELEQAARLAPEVPDIQVALARGYARAGRTEDVERARARLSELLAAQRPEL
jgi:tetratricopeptide (TPR) repeat protein